MSKTLRIISVITAIFVVAMVVLPAFSGYKIDENMQQMLNGPGIIELCKNNIGNSQENLEDSPLVKQAQQFALFLNPPPPPPTQVQTNTASYNEPVPPRPVQVAPKFDLVATSYFTAKPELSLALIDEPGKGLSWVRPSSQVGHLTIEEIKDGVIVIRDGNRTYDISTQRPPRVSLIKGENSNISRPSVSTPVSTAPSAPTAANRPASTKRRTSAKTTSQDSASNMPDISQPAVAQEMPKETPQPEVDPEEIAKWEKFMSESQNLSEEEWLKKAEELLRTDGRVSQDEAENLDRLGQGLNEN